jgi:hypothetical protein
LRKYKEGNMTETKENKEKIYLNTINNMKNIIIEMDQMENRLKEINNENGLSLYLSIEGVKYQAQIQLTRIEFELAKIRDE